MGNFYKSIVNTSQIDLDSIPLQEKLIYAEKKNFALKIKDGLRNLLIELEELQHVGEESPFYEKRKDIKHL